MVLDFLTPIMRMAIGSLDSHLDSIKYIALVLH